MADPVVAPPPAAAAPPPAAAPAAASVVEANKDAPAAPAAPAQKEAAPEGKPTETSKEQAKPADQAALDIKLPEGWKKDDANLVSFLEMAKKGPLTPQGVIDHFAQMQAKGAEQLKSLVVSDTAALKTELGGNFDATVAAARTVLERAPGGPEVSKVLDAHFLQAHPVLVKFLASLRPLLSEDTIAGRSGGPTLAPMSREQELKKMFPNSPGMFGG